MPAAEDADGRILESQVPISLHPMPLKHLTQFRFIQTSLHRLLVENRYLQSRSWACSAGTQRRLMTVGGGVAFPFEVYTIHASFTLCDIYLGIEWEDHAGRPLLAKMNATNG